MLTFCYFVLPCHLLVQISHPFVLSTMPSPPPAWVQALKPSGPQGSELLAKEREQSNVAVDALAELLHTKKTLERQQELVKVLQSEKVFDKAQSQSLGRVERLQSALRKGKRLHQLSVERNWTLEEYHAAAGLLGEPTPYALHASMFLVCPILPALGLICAFADQAPALQVTLREQSNPEQRKLFLDRAEKYEIIGCYAQTELGHGSNVRGLETTATWNPEDKTFTLHSPALTASKWWIGSLGRTANHAVVMAQLFIGNKNYGPHPFVVQIRDLETHQPLENVYVGDIGPKFGYK